MASLNRVMLIGNLGADPEMTYTQAGTAKATLRLATNESWTNKDGEKTERTEWHRVIAWGKLAEIVGQYATKGRPIFVEGRLQTRSWDDKDGNKRYMTEIVATSMQLLGGSRAQGDQDQGPGPTGAAYGAYDPNDEVPF